MDVLVVRHGIAMDREKAASRGVLDHDRPLTRKGRTRMREIARGLHELAPALTELISSPLLRAVETAGMVREAYGELKQGHSAALLPEAEPGELARALGRRAVTSSVAVVGHEPHLGSFMSWCLTGSARSFFELPKGGACLMRFEDRPAAGAGRLIWLLPPAVLRSL
ncbi:MAG TPA: histidine phosphatase family protein [Polyangiales bacterium]